MDALYNDTGSQDMNETAFCSLSAIVPSNIDSEEEYKEVADVAVKAVTQMIFKAPKMTPNMERTMLERMSLGIGISGLAEYLYKKGVDYDGSKESYEVVARLSELHYHSLLTASIKMVEDGTLLPVKGIDSNWLPIDTKRSKFEPIYDWESLRGKERGHSVLSAIMPAESSSCYSGTSNSVYPPRSKYVYKKSRKGSLLFICEGFEEGRNVSAWDIDNKVLSTYYALIQDYTDQAISADDYFNQDKYKEFKGKKPLSKLIEEWVAHFAMGNKTKYYTNTKMDSSNSARNFQQSEVATGLLGGVDIDEEGEGCESCTL